jgi:hypothetical protein
MEQSNTSPIRLRYGRAVNQLLGVAAALGFSYLFWRGGISGWPAVVWFLFAALVILLCLSFGSTHFQPAPPRVFREWRFLGFIPIWQRDYPLVTFSGVQPRLQRGPQPSDSYWFVGLVERSGRFLAVQWFYTGSEAPCEEANRYASRLSEITGLPLAETQVV